MYEILLVVAIVLFIASALIADHPRGPLLLPLGLAAFAGAFLAQTL